MLLLKHTVGTSAATSSAIKRHRPWSGAKLAHPDFAVAVSQPFSVTTSVGVNGAVIALGRWVDPDATSDPDHEPTGTLYLVIDETKERPLCIAQADISSTELTTTVA